ncbi:hypothetical protein [Glycomyces albidus]|jgi:hypothetical protein|uniref:Uncharacterized protein n=1 Tax=Glycomyces albidus TaxID=2656774 RepID=A0A6L5GDC1_9ACTN|nr:hypothetical protein [Glycomyces albidus]MQM27674.1 hypothetical protein [Glycomyces albidus]
MPSTRWISAPAGKVRRFAARLARRAEPLPRLPFAVALAVAAVVLAVSVEWEPRPYDDIAEVTELPSALDPEIDFSGGAQVEFEILEYGFGTVEDELGAARVIVGAVIRNPFDTAIISPGGLDITVVKDDGVESTLEKFYPNPIPAGTTMRLGFVITAPTEGVPLERLRLSTSDPSFLAPDPEGLSEAERAYAVVPPMPDVELLSVEPLLSPEGYRLQYRVVSDQAQGILLTVLFRDAEGRLLGGLPAGEDPFSFELGSAGWRTVEEGETLQELDLHAAWIPEGADLDSVEIGPRAMYMG